MSDALSRVNDFMRDHDIEFVRHDSFDGFEDLDIDRQGYGVYPGFTPAVSPDGMWIEARMFNRPIATMAAQPIVMESTLTDHLEGEGLFPSDHDRWEVTGEARRVCDMIRDFTVFTGGYLIAPDFQRKNNPESKVSELLMAVFPRLTRELARRRWHPEYLFFTVKAGRSLIDRYAPEGIAEGLRWYRYGKLLEGRERVIGYMSAAFVEERAASLA